jgi:hypothetical protein
MIPMDSEGGEILDEGTPSGGWLYVPSLVAGEIVLGAGFFRGFRLGDDCVGRFSAERVA